MDKSENNAGQIEPVADTSNSLDTNVKRTLSWPVILLLVVASGYVGSYFGYEKGVQKAPVRFITRELPESDKKSPESAREASKENYWYRHVDENGFSLLIPEGYMAKPIENGVSIISTENDVGYDIRAKNGVANLDEVVAFVQEMYGSDCTVTVKTDNDSSYEYDEYNVLPPENGGDCNAFKVTLYYMPYLEQALTWSGFQEPIMPMDSDSYTNWLENNAPVNEVFYDFVMLNTIQFEFE
jgi:hypothetical protein